MQQSLKLSKTQKSHRLTLQTDLVHPLQTDGYWQDSHRLYTAPLSSPFLLSPPVSFKDRKACKLNSSKDRGGQGESESNADRAIKKRDSHLERKKKVVLLVLNTGTRKRPKTLQTDSLNAILGMEKKPM